MSFIWDVFTTMCAIQFILYLWGKLWHPAGTRGFRSETWWITAHIVGPIDLLETVRLQVLDPHWTGYVFIPINVALWWFYIVKDKDRDDRWKKRRKKATAKIKEVAGRLVVVPLPNPA